MNKQFIKKREKKVKITAKGRAYVEAMPFSNARESAEWLNNYEKLIVSDGEYSFILSRDILRLKRSMRKINTEITNKTIALNKLI